MASQKIKKRAIDYRFLYKALRGYHAFSFPLPHYRRSFTPPQKAAITRQYNKIYKAINNVTKNFYTFIPLKKRTRLPGVDGIRTNKGIFFKFPGAKLVKAGKELFVVMRFNQLREVFIPFPVDIMFSLDLIREYVDGVAGGFTPLPDYVRWSVNGHRSYSAFEDFDDSIDSALQAEKKSDDPIAQSQGAKQGGLMPFFNGVFFGWEPGRGRIWVRNGEKNVMLLSTVRQTRSSTAQT